MSSLFLALYGTYLLLVGVEGNGPTLFTAIGSEHQFLSWIIIMIVIVALWEAPLGQTGGTLAKSFAALIVIGFLLHNNNYKILGTNLTAILSTTQPTTQG
jgi:hypothetical protein